MNNFIIVLILLLSVFATLVSAAEKVPEPSHGISYPEGWQNWGTIAVSHRIDNNTLRVILGNDVAIKAARIGNTMLYLAKLSGKKKSWKIGRKPLYRIS
jgi:hypothetical protein